MGVVYMIGQCCSRKWSKARDAYLGEPQGLEKGRDTDKSNLVVPHDDMLLVGRICGAEFVMKDYDQGQKAMYGKTSREGSIP